MWGLSFVVDLDFYFYNPLFRTRVFHRFHIMLLQSFIGAQVTVYNVSYYVLGAARLLALITVCITLIVCVAL
jgi:hypothetical protein